MVGFLRHVLKPVLSTLGAQARTETSRKSIQGIVSERNFKEDLFSRHMLVLRT